MVVNSLSIVPQDVGCNARCKYCIAHMTKPARENLGKPGILLQKLEKCIRYACDSGATTAIITSSGETLRGSWTTIENILWLCQRHFGQIDLHTNGTEIITRPPCGQRGFNTMIAPYITNITITVPHYMPQKISDLMWGGTKDKDAIIGMYNDVFEQLKTLGIRIRLSCVVCKEGVGSSGEIEKYIEWARARGIDEVVFRELWTPNLPSSEREMSEQEEWCYKNKIPMNEINDWMLNLIGNFNLNRRRFLDLYENSQPADFDGTAVSWSTCTENMRVTDCGTRVKSLVYRPDNNLYPDWDTRVRIM